VADLKPANCLIDEKGCVKIADMNISKVSNGEMMKVSRSQEPLSSPRAPADTSMSYSFS
jgi:serine/threonine protein kinase